MGLWVGLAITGTHFVSVNLWENYSILYRSSFLDSISEDIGRSRNSLQPGPAPGHFGCGGGRTSLCRGVGLMMSTVHIWFLQIQRIERTQDLFVWKIHKGAFLEQSMLLNIRFEIQKDSKQKRETDPVTVYLCATMWHETCDEIK